MNRQYECDNGIDCEWNGADCECQDKPSVNYVPMIMTHGEFWIYIIISFSIGIVIGLLF